MEAFDLMFRTAANVFCSHVLTACLKFNISHLQKKNKLTLTEDGGKTVSER